MWHTLWNISAGILIVLAGFWGITIDEESDNEEHQQHAANEQDSNEKLEAQGTRVEQGISVLLGFVVPLYVGVSRDTFEKDAEDCESLPLERSQAIS